MNRLHVVKQVESGLNWHKIMEDFNIGAGKVNKLHSLMFDITQYICKYTLTVVGGAIQESEKSANWNRCRSIVIQINGLALYSTTPSIVSLKS